MLGKISKSSVDTLKPGGRDAYLWDKQLPGFGLKVTPKGAKTYVLKYRLRGAQKWLKIGRHGALTADEARDLAKVRLGEIAGGADPAAARDAHSDSPTVAELADRYLEEYAEPHKKARSVEEDRRNLKLHVRPALGALKVADVTRQDILRLHHEMRATPAAANRVLALLSKMMGVAEEWGLRSEGANPCKRVKKFEEKGRERFLSADEIKRLGAALADMEGDKAHHPSGLAIVRLLLLTGCRLSEILTLQWGHIDFERSCLRLPDSKTGSKVVRLGAAPAALLAKLPRGTSPYVFPVARGATVSPDRKRKVGPGHFTGVGRIWQRARSRAKLDGVRLHDLRHTFASWAVMGGATLHVAGALLGHTQAATTMRYAHLADDPLQAAAQRVASGLAAALEGKEAAPIEKLPRRRPARARGAR